MLDPTYRLLQGDVLYRLRQLPENSVHCVVTSPPYFGLRDYGTAEWEGGDEDCDHKRPVMPRRDRAEGLLGGGRNTIDAQDDGTKAFKDLCGKCGAVRNDQQIGLEKTPAEYIAKMVSVFREVRRVLRRDGTCWVNIGDSYTNAGQSGGTKIAEDRGQLVRRGAMNGDRRTIDAALKPKDLMGMPWRLAFALQADGWYLRQDIIWAKPNPMPESVLDRCTKAHEYIFLLTKSARYFYDAEAIKEEANCPEGAGNYDNKGAAALRNGDARFRTYSGLADIGPRSTRNKRSVWEIATEPYPEAHFATYPTKLVEPCILAGTSEKGVCAGCGAPWMRILETERINQSGSGKAGNLPDGKGAGGTQVREDHDIRMGPTTSTVTIGWKASCKCSGHETTNATVLDPFNGSGTTGLVALANRCNYIGIDLNPEYIEMAEERLSLATAQRNLL